MGGAQGTVAEMGRRQMAGHALVLIGAAAVAIGGLGRWVGNGGGLPDSEFVTPTERTVTVVVGIVGLVVGLAVWWVQARTDHRLGWTSFAMWAATAVVVFISALDVKKKVDSIEVFSSKPGYDPHPGSVGWGWWLLLAGVAVGLVGMVMAHGRHDSRDLVTD